MSKPWGRLRKFLWPSQKNWTLQGQLPCQSVPTIHSFFENMGWFVTLEKGSKICVTKSRVQKTESLLFKKRRGNLASSFFEWPCFLHPPFFTPYFGPFFNKVPDPKQISGQPDKLEQWDQIDWARVVSEIGMTQEQFPGQESKLKLPEPLYMGNQRPWTYCYLLNHFIIS